ncbi:MAG: hydroxymethylglutaryl-CoA lyase [Synergistaceae bacterium]|jgi:hydroxymethylglutaryl-CoA lyase|nr:hydroxymethylglutaryl-CoA lyase [Synergistaceae bacterium]
MDRVSYPQRAYICEDVTRDGFQNLNKSVSVEDKLRLLDMIADAGIQSIEVGAFSPYESMKMMRNTPEVFKKLKRRENVLYRALVFDPNGAKEAAECGCGKIKINISASDAHHKGGTGMTTADALHNFAAIGEIAKDAGMQMAGSISLPFRSPFEGEGFIPFERLCGIIRSFIDIGISEISLSDAAGLGDPRLIYTRFSELKELFPDVSWMLHMHNTYGMGLAGIDAALRAGVTKFDSSLAGLGGCPYIKGARGNVATEDLVFMLECMGIETGTDFDLIIEAGQEAERIAGGDGCDSVIQRIGRSNGKVKRITL